jgi:hypothetical protein
MNESVMGVLMLVPMSVGPLAEPDKPTVVRSSYVSEPFDRRSVALIEKQVDKSGYRRAKGTDEATYHAEKRDGGPRVSRRTSQTDQIAG